MPTTDDTHRYFRIQIDGKDVLIIVPSELSNQNINEIEKYFAVVIDKLDRG